MTGRGGIIRATAGVKVLNRYTLDASHSLQWEGQTHKSYSLFMTSFSMPSIALSNSASVAFFHTSVSRMRSAMN